MVPPSIWSGQCSARGNTPDAQLLMPPASVLGDRDWLPAVRGAPLSTGPVNYSERRPMREEDGRSPCASPARFIHRWFR